MVLDLGSVEYLLKVKCSYFIGLDFVAAYPTRLI